MSYKWVGAVLVIAACGGFGVSLAAGHRRQERLLRQLLRALHTMRWELQYRLTPLPELCRRAGEETPGPLREIFRGLSRELDAQVRADVPGCMQSVLKKTGDLPVSMRRMLRQLGRTLGRFDLEGQLQGLDAVKAAREEELAELSRNRETRLRSYQTLALCAGAALAILFA